MVFKFSESSKFSIQASQGRSLVGTGDHSSPGGLIVCPQHEVLGFSLLKRGLPVGTRETVRTRCLPPPHPHLSQGGRHPSWQVSPLQEDELTFAFRNTCPRQGELPAGWLFLNTAALFTGMGPSASLVSQLDMGELSRVRCLKTGDCPCRQKTPHEAWSPGPLYVPALRKAHWQRVGSAWRSPRTTLPPPPSLLCSI